MSGQGVHIQFTSDHQKVMQGMAKQLAAMEKQVATLRKMNRTGKRTKETFGGLTKTLAGVAGGMFGLHRALATFNSELEHTKNLQVEVATTQVTLAQARKDIIRNMAGAADAEINRVRESVTKIAREQRVPERFVAAAMASALSASGGNIAASEAAVGGATRFLADRPEGIGAYAGSLLDISKVTGTSDAMVNLGFLSMVGARSRVVNPKLQAQNIPRGLIGMRSFGATPQGSAALFAALTTGSGDITGAPSATGGIRLAEQLETFMPGKKTMTERIAALQASPKQAHAFLDQASFEVIVKGPIRDLLTNVDSAIAKQFKENLASLPAMKELGEFGRKLLEQRKLDPLERAARLQRTYAGASEQLMASNLLAGRGGISRKGLAKVLKATDIGWMDLQLQMGRYEVSSRAGTYEPMRAAEQVLAARMHRLRGEEYDVLRGKWVPGGEEVPSEGGLLAADRLELLVRELEQLRRSREQETGGMRDMTDKQDETNVILQQILAKEPGTLRQWGPVGPPRIPSTGPTSGGGGGGPIGPVGPGEVRGEIDDPLEAWAAANELMNRQGWSRIEKVRAWKKFRREHLPGLEPGDRPEGGWMPDPSDLAGEDRQKLRNMVADLGYVVDVLTQQLKKLSDAAENVTVVSEPME